ncbi:MAG: hypothetical protein MJE68_23245 [Proteobacteria bacterium]|nr:hypothetical protein [Pseudomonadota bacterium]
MAKNSKKQASAGAKQDWKTEHKILSNKVTMLQWAMGFGFGTVLVVIATLGQYTASNIGEINALRQENVEIRADHNELRLEFEVYKAQNPPQSPAS